MYNISLSINERFKSLIQNTDPTILKCEGIHESQLNFSNNRTKKTFTIDDNANTDHAVKSNIVLLNNECLKPIIKLNNYNTLFTEIEALYNSDIADKCLKAIITGDLYFHDSSSFIETHYCYAVSTQYLLDNGLSFNDQLESLPPKKITSYIDQCKEFCIQLSNEQSGALALADLFVNIVNFIDDFSSINLCISDVIKNFETINLSKNDWVKKLLDNLQSFVHTINQPMRHIHQSPFINLSIYDKPTLETLFSEVLDTPEKIEFVILIQKVFCIWFSKGNPKKNGEPYRFPVITLNVKIDENKKVLDQEMFDFYAALNLNKGNFNIYVSEGEKIASCCRLLNDFSSIDNFGNGGVNLGSLRVCTINFPAIHYSCIGGNERYEDVLKDRVLLCSYILLAQKNIVEKSIKNGYLQFFLNGIININRLFSTIGIIGVYEFTQMHDSVTMHDCLKNLKDYVNELKCPKQKLWNIEQIPGESAAIKLAAKDFIRYNSSYEMYSNQIIPLDVEYDMVQRIKATGECEKLLTGGGILHINLSEKLETVHQMKKIINYCIQHNCTHFAINYVFGRCKKGHLTCCNNNKTDEFCAICGDKIISKLTRIVGYFSPIDQWNKGRREEFFRRKFIKF